VAPIDAGRLTTVERAALLSSLARFPERLGVAARASDAVGPPPAGEWGPHEVVRHLIAVEVDVHQARLTDLATVADPHWSWAEPGPWPGEPSLSLSDLLDRFTAHRAATVAIAAAVDDEGWARTGTHATLGRWDVGGLLANAVDHDEVHLIGLATTD
jgi:hypothetical protein